MLDRCIPYKYKKWTTLLGCVLLNLATGSFYTYGNMNPYLTSYMREYAGIEIRYSASIWISSVFTFTLSLANFFTGWFNTSSRLSLKHVILIGCLIMSFGVGITYFSLQISFWLVLLTYGALYGLGAGIAYVAPMTIIMRWFPKSQGLANSAILSANGFSILIFNQVQTFYINPQNLPPDKPYSPEFKDEKYFSRENDGLLERVPTCCLILFACYLILQLLGLSLISETNEDQDYDELESLVKQSSDEKNSLGVKYLLESDGMTLREAMKTFEFWDLVLIINFSNVASFNVLNYYKTFGQTFIQDDKYLALVGSISSIFNGLGRFAWGFMIDKCSGRITLLTIQTSMIAAISTLYMTKLIGSKHVFGLWICFVLFSTGGILTALPPIVAKTFGQKHFLSIYGAILLLRIFTAFLSSILASLQDILGWFWFFFINTLVSSISWPTTFFYAVAKSDGSDI